MMASPVPPGLFGVVGPVVEPQKLFVASSAPDALGVYPPVSSSKPAVAFPWMLLLLTVTLAFGPTEKGSAITTPCVKPLEMMLWVTWTPLSPPPMTICEAVEAVIVLWSMTIGLATEPAFKSATALAFPLIRFCEMVTPALPAAARRTPAFWLVLIVLLVIRAFVRP